MRKALAFFFLVLLFSQCLAVIQSDSVKVFAVTDNGNALSADLLLKIQPGTGKVWTSVEPLVGTSTQSTEKLAVKISKRYSTAVDQFDYFFEIESDASLVEGPSAGAAMTLLVISMLQDKPVPDEVAITGTITVAGGVGSVGGVFEKSKEAAKIGIELFLIPKGESRQTVKIDNTVRSINLVDYAEKNWGLKVVEVGNIDDVLKYAFADIEAIDVNADVPAVDFVPKQIELSENLVLMKTLTERYISDAENSIRSAKTALSGTLLDKPALTDLMLTNLNESEKMLAQSKILYEQNYLYSSANYAFLAMVNSGFVRNVAENPGLLSRASTAFNAKVDALNERVDSLAFDLNKFVLVDYFEWHVASKERLSWAKLKIEGLQAQDEIIIIVEQNGIDWERVSELMDYQYALAWYTVSQDFFELTKESRRAILPDAGLWDLAYSYIEKTEEGLSSLPEEETEDIVRRLNSAKLSLNSGWTYAALFDSASSLALVNAELFSKDKDLIVLQDELYSRIGQLQQKIDESSHDLVWAQLYLDHSRYYLDSCLFYQEQGQATLALNSAKNGIDLVFLAEGVFDAASASYSHFAVLPGQSFVDVASGWRERPWLDTLIQILLVLLALVASIVIFALVASGQKFHLLKPFSFEDRFDDILSEQRKLRKKLEKGYLTRQHFDVLNEPMQKRLNKLLAGRRALSADYVRLDLDKSKVAAFERALRDLRGQLNRKQVTKEDFESNTAFYRKRIALLKHLIKEEEKRIASGKKMAESEFRKGKPRAKS